MKQLAVTPHATCAGCGCTCDDIQLEDDGIRVTRAENACGLGETWFRDHTAERRFPDALIDGREAPLADAIDAAAELLTRADMPLIYGLGRATCEAQRQAAALAERLGATIDTETSLSHAAMELAAQAGGKITCTLGEIRNRADLVIYWGANPAVTHPRHMERYTTGRGKFTPRGRTDRTLVVVDTRDTPSTAAADVFLRIRPNADFEALTVLRAVVQGKPFDAAQLTATGLGVDQLRDLAGRMKRARYGAFFVGMGLFRTRGHFMNCAAVTALAIDLNAFARFISMPLRTPGNVGGADAILSYTTGHPFGVNFSRGYPRYNPGEFTAADLLERGDVDAALVVGGESLNQLPPAAHDGLTRIPSILLDGKPIPGRSGIQITTAAGGVTAPGTVYRMDKVPLTTRPPLTSPYPSDEEVLRRIRAAVGKKSEWCPTATAAMPVI